MAAVVRKDMAYAAGVISILLAAVGFGLVICSFIFAGKVSGVVTPYWSAFPIVLQGIAGVVILFTKNQCLMIFWMVLCIIMIIVSAISSALTGLAHLVWKLAADILDAYKCQSSNNKCMCYSSDGSVKEAYSIGDCSDVRAVSDLLQAMAALSALACILSFSGSILGCVSVCCLKAQAMVGVVVIETQPAKTTATATAPPQEFGVHVPHNSYPPPVQ